ncbi:MAG: hypothetical protein ABII79_00470 [bacterium]
MSKSLLQKAARTTLVVGIVICLAATGSAMEQVPAKSTAVYIGAGASIPVSPDEFQDFWSVGFHGTIGVGLKVTRTLYIVGKTEYHSMPFSWGTFGVTGVSGAALRAFMVGGDARFVFGSSSASANGVFFAGLGVANLSFSDISAPGIHIPLGFEETKLYINLGGGVEIKTGSTMKVFIQGTVVSVATSGESTGFMPLTVGLRF